MDGDLFWQQQNTNTHLPPRSSLLTPLFPTVTEAHWSSSPEPPIHTQQLPLAYTYTHENAHAHARTCTPQDSPGPPLSHPPLMLSLLIVVLVVAVVPPPGSCCNHSPGLARGVVGTVFCTGAAERWHGHFGAWPCFSLQEVWRQTLDTSKGSYAHPWQYPLFPTLVALESKSSAHVPRQCRRFWSL